MSAPPKCPKVALTVYVRAVDVATFHSAGMLPDGAKDALVSAMDRLGPLELHTIHADVNTYRAQVADYDKKRKEGLEGRLGMKGLVFTPEQVAAIDVHQNSPAVHPLTCPVHGHTLLVRRWGLFCPLHGCQHLQTEVGEHVIQMGEFLATGNLPASR